MGLTGLIIRKDLRLLARSRMLLALVVTYPLLVALVAGAVLVTSGSNATVALVNEAGIDAISLGDETFEIDGYLERVADEITVQSMPTTAEAMRALDAGQVDAVLVVPPSFRETAETMLSPAELRFYTGDNPLGDLIAERARGAIYALNLDLSSQLIEVNSGYLRTLVDGGDAVVVGQRYSLLGLSPAIDLLEEIIERSDDPRIRSDAEQMISFAQDASLAMNFAGGALEATARPVELVRVSAEGASPALSARALSYVAALVGALLCAVVAASFTAAERDEGVGSRLLQGQVTPSVLIAAKVLTGALLSMLATLGLFVVFAIAESQDWLRLPLLVAAAAVAGLTFAALGAALATLTPDGRSAALAAVLVVLPLLPLAAAGSMDVANAVNQLFPLVPAADLFNTVLYETRPARGIATGVAHLVAIGAVLTAVAVRRAGRLALR